mmetsp:Transcript_4019/g.14300  ORF Transcript_4019/g.14300 Transcript_4019/m.14300 type:complete len:164 (-) Transcript_4019:268-759(-)
MARASGSQAVGKTTAAGVEGDRVGNKFEPAKAKPAKGKMTARMRRPKKRDDHIQEEEDLDYEEDELDPKSGKKKRRIRWTPIALMFLLVICPMFIGFAAYIADTFFPAPTQSPEYRAARAQLYEIYGEHNPEKIDDIPRLLEKYKGRERALVANVRSKYESGS